MHALALQAAGSANLDPVPFRPVAPSHAVWAEATLALGRLHPKTGEHGALSRGSNEKIIHFSLP
jgi:streptogramin lyase